MMKDVAESGINIKKESNTEETLGFYFELLDRAVKAWESLLDWFDSVKSNSKYPHNLRDGEILDLKLILYASGQEIRSLTSSIQCTHSSRRHNSLFQPKGKLNAQVGSQEEAKPCLLSPKVGYRGLENQLYRVEIHEQGPCGIATFKLRINPDQRCQGR